MGGGHSTTSTYTNQGVAVPAETQALMNQVTPDIGQAYAQAPLSQFTATAPPEGVQPLSPEQRGYLGQIQATAGEPNLNAPEQQALGVYQNLMATGPGQSPATQAAIQALEQQFNRYTLPSIQNQAALAGLGKSGALTDAIAAARSGVSAAEVPLLQSDIQNQIIGAQGATGLGQYQQQREVSQPQTAFDAAEIERQQQQAVLQEQVQNYLRLQDIAGGISGAVFGMEPATFGSQTSTRQISPTPPIWSTTLSGVLNPLGGMTGGHGGGGTGGS